MLRLYLLKVFLQVGFLTELCLYMSNKSMSQIAKVFLFLYILLGTYMCQSMSLKTTECFSISSTLNAIKPSDWPASGAAFSKETIHGGLTKK